MNWFLLGLIPPAVWSITNHMDKYLLSKYIKGGGVGALMIFSSLIGLLLLPIIYIIHPDVLNISVTTALLIMLNAFLYIIAVLPYYYALMKDEASIVVPMFQLIPVISYAIAFVVLGETLASKQIIGGILIIFGAIALALELTHGKTIKFKKEVFWLMLLSSFLLSINFTFFKFFALESNFWVTSFWEYMGFLLFAILILVFIKPYRDEFTSLLKQNGVAALSLNGTNEILNIVAKVAFNYASMLAPLTLIWIVNGLQPLFVFLYGILLTIFFPKISKENITKKDLLQKGIAIIVILAGTYILG